MPNLRLFFDGGCRPNPGPIEVAAVARGVAYFDDDLGVGSNGDAEWLAAIHALRVAGTLGALDVTLIGDSAVVVAQATGKARCRGRRRRRIWRRSGRWPTGSIASTCAT